MGEKYQSILKCHGATAHLCQCWWRPTHRRRNPAGRGAQDRKRSWSNIRLRLFWSCLSASKTELVERKERHWISGKQAATLNYCKASCNSELVEWKEQHWISGKKVANVNWFKNKQKQTNKQTTRTTNTWYELSVANLLSFEHRRVFRELWCNQLWQSSEEGCRKPVFGV